MMSFITLFKNTAEVLLLIILLITFCFLSLPFVVATDWFREYASAELSKAISRDIVIGKNIALSLGSNTSLLIEDIHLKNPDGFTDGDMLQIGSLGISALLLENLSGSFQLSKITLSKVLMIVMENSEGTLNWNFPSEEKPAEPEASSGPIKIPPLGDIELLDSRIRLVSISQNKEVRITSFKGLNFKAEQPVHLLGEFGYKDKPLTLSANVNSIGRLIDESKIDLNLDLDLGSQNIQAVGLLNLDDESNLSISVKGEDLSELSLFLPVDLPSWKNYSLSTKSRFNLASIDTLKFTDIKLEVDGNDLAGEIETTLEPVSIKANLSSENLDIGALVGDNKTESKLNNNEPKIPFDTLEALNADIELSVKKLRTFLDLDITNASVKASLKDGHLKIHPAKGKIFGGTFTSYVSAQNKNVHLSLEGNGFRAIPITLLAGGTPILEGKFRVSTELRASGERLSEILSSLTGKVDIDSGDAHIQSGTLNTASSSLSEILSPIMGDDDETSSECILFNYVFENGIGRSKEQVIKLDDVFIFAEGEIDLPRNELTYNFNVNSTNPALASLIPPFRAYGPLSDPTFVPSVSGSIASVADTAQGVAGSVIGTVGGAAALVLYDDEEELKGIEVCKAAYKSEQNKLSSIVGDAID